MAECKAGVANSDTVPSTGATVRLPELGGQENCGFIFPHVAELLINQHQRFLISVGVLPVEFFMNLEKSRRRRNPRVIAMRLILKSRLPVRNVRHISSSFDFLNSRNVTPLASLTDFSMSCRSLRKDEGEIAKYSEDRKRELSIDFIKYPKQSANHSCTLFLSRPSCLVRVTPCTSKTAEIAYQESWNPDVCPPPLCSSAPPLLCRPPALRQLSIVDP